jgi:hypothetical protein
MKCEEAIRLIHLDRQGERSSEESEMLRLHLESCERCASEALLVRLTDPFLRQICASHPALALPENLSQAIMNELARARREGPAPRAQGALETFLDLFQRPAIRYGYIIVVLFFTALFMITEADALRSMDALSAKLARSTEPPRTDIRYSMPLKDARNIVGTSQLEPLLANTPVRVSNDQLIVHKSEIDPWTSSLTTRLSTRLLSSSETPAERIPDVLLELQKSISYSLSLRAGGNAK